MNMKQMVASEGKVLKDSRNGRTYHEVQCKECDAHFFVEVEA